MFKGKREFNMYNQYWSNLSHIYKHHSSRMPKVVGRGNVPLPKTYCLSTYNPQIFSVTLDSEKQKGHLLSNLW